MANEKKKSRLPRKLKKAVKQCVGYYDGYYLVPPTYPGSFDGRLHYKRRTKWIERACDRYDALEFDWWDGKCPNFQSKRAKIIDEHLSHLYFVKNVSRSRNKRYMPQRKTSLKWHREHGEIFVYARNGVVYPKGAWIPKEKPKDMYFRCCSMREDIPVEEKYMVTHSVYSYQLLRRVDVEKFFITKEEFDDKTESAAKLYMRYLNEHPDKLIKVNNEKDAK